MLLTFIYLCRAWLILLNTLNVYIAFYLMQPNYNIESLGAALFQQIVSWFSFFVLVALVYFHSKRTNETTCINKIDVGIFIIQLTCSIFVIAALIEHLD